MDDPTPPPAASPLPNPAGAPVPPPVDDGSGVPPNIAAAICAAIPLVGGIVFLVLEKKNPFVRFWAMQSIFFGGAATAISIVLQIATLVFAHIPILGWLVAILLALASIAFGIVIVIVWIITIIKAFSNVEWEIPYLGKLARKQLATQTLV